MIVVWDLLCLDITSKKERKNLMKRLLSLALAVFMVLTIAPVSAFAVTYDLGTKNEDPSFDVIINAPTCYSVGETVTVNVFVRNINTFNGLSDVEFELIYDSNKLVLANDLLEKESNVVDCVTSLPTSSWENLTKVEHTVGSDGVATPKNDGIVDVTLLYAGVGSVHFAKEDDAIALSFTFEVLESASGEIPVYVPHSSVSGLASTLTDFEFFVGNGSGVTINPHDPIIPDTCGEETACSVCGETLADAVEHSFTNYVSNGDATCTSDGTKTAKCDNCDATDTVADIGSKKDHVFGTDWTFDETNHWHKCTSCDEVSGVTAHDFSNGDKCECGYEKEHIHSFGTKVDEIPAGCETDGRKAYFVCDGCGKWYSDENATVEFEEKESDPDLIISETGHSFTNYVSDGNATCLEDGTKTAKCDNGCDATDTVADEDSAKGHTEGAWTIISNPQIGVPGLREKRCGECGTLLESEEIPALEESKILGDVDGDGEITPTDYILVKRHVMGTYELTGSALKNADVDKDGLVTFVDYILLKRHIMGSYVIK